MTDLHVIEGTDLHVIDGHGWFYRAYYGSLASATEPDHAVTTFRAMLREYAEKHQPSHLVVALDIGRESFRSQIFPGYKANRKPVPPELAWQLSQFSVFLDELGVAHLGAAGYEADDVIGTLCKRFADTYRIFIATNDKDLMQLVTANVSLINSQNESIGPADVGIKFGVLPEQVIEVLALMGDQADGIPGVAGIGEKTAVMLIQGWLNLEYLYEHLDDIDRTKMKNVARIWGLLDVGKEAAFISRCLATINCDVPLAVEIEDFKWRAQL